VKFSPISNKALKRIKIC